MRCAADTEGYLVKTKHLNTSSLNCLEPLEKFEYTSDLIHAVRVEEPVILLSMTPGYLPTYCIASPEKPIYVNHGIKIFRLKRNCSWVLPEYLCYELSRRLKNHRKALPIDLFNAIFLQLKLAFPSRNLEEQKLVVKEANPHCIMTSYNKLNGVYAYYNYDLVNVVLREEFGFNGLVMTDWWMKDDFSLIFAGLKNPPRILMGLRGLFFETLFAFFCHFFLFLYQGS